MAKDGQMYDVMKVREDFPILSRQVNGKTLTYLDIIHIHRLPNLAQREQQ